MLTLLCPQFILLLAIFMAASAAAFTAKLSIKQCDQQGCKPVQKRVALDATSNGTEHLIAVNGTDSLTLSYGGAHLGGPRVYLIEEDGIDKNTMFMLKNQEFTFDVELSTMQCGFNAALYFVGMGANEGGAEKGTKYCDAQAVDGVFCSEMDILESNTDAQQYTTHACIDACGSFSTAAECKSNGQASTVCDQSGCGLNPFRYGPGTTYDTETNNANWHGVGSKFQLDSSKPFTVVTQFHAGSANELASVVRFYLQSRRRVDLPTLYVRKPTDGITMGALENPSITSDFCTDIYDRWSGQSDYEPLRQMGKNMESGMVLAMSAWYAPETYKGGRPSGTVPGGQSGAQTGMSWLDGLNEWGSPAKLIKAGPCEKDTIDTGVHHATFSNIRTGDIGTTVPNAPRPAPTPPSPPSPPPSAGQCCSNNVCSGSSCQGGWCGQSQAHCEGNCNGKWCPHAASVGPLKAQAGCGFPCKGDAGCNQGVGCAVCNAGFCEPQ